MKAKKKIKKENKRGKTFVGFAPKLKTHLKLNKEEKRKNINTSYI